MKRKKYLKITILLLIYFTMQQSLYFTEHGPKKYPVSSASLGKNALLMSDFRGK